MTITVKTIIKQLVLSKKDLSEIQKSVITKLCKSNTFSNAPTSIALLQYLYAETKKGTFLKETVIALDFFGKEAPETTVRVNVYNLRKKIAQYYETEGTKDTWIVQIQKGQYKISFSENKNQSTSKTTIKNIQKWFLVSAILFFLALGWFWLPRNDTTLFWKDFINDKRPTLLVVGDVFGIIGKTATGNVGFIRDYQLNTIEDYYKFVQTNPDLKNKFIPAPYSYTNQMGVEGSSLFSTFFTKNNSQIEIRFTSTMSIEELKENNCIYIGPTKTKPFFVDLFNNVNPYFKIKDSLLYRTNHPSKKDTIYKLEYRVHNRELAIVSRIPGPNGTNQLLFFSNHDIGVKSCIKYFLSNSKLKDLTASLKGKSFFTAVFEAKGTQRSDTNLELLEIIPF